MRLIPMTFIINIVVLLFVASCNENKTLTGNEVSSTTNTAGNKSGSNPVQAMAYSNKGLFPTCNASSNGLVVYSIEDGQFFMCNGSTYEVTGTSPGKDPSSASGGTNATSNLLSCADALATPMPQAQGNTGIIVITPPAGIDACSLEGYVVGKEGEIRLKKTRNGEIFFADLTPGIWDFILKGASASTLSSGQTVSQPLLDKAVRVSGTTVEAGKTVAVGQFQMNPLVKISGKATLQVKPVGGDDSGILVTIPGTSYTTLTSTSGFYELSGIPPGVHGLNFQKAGYKRNQLTNLDCAISTVANPIELLIAGTGDGGSAVVSNGVKLANGKFHTNTFQVDLSITPGQDASLMMISEDDLFIGSKWIPISSSHSYTLTSPTAEPTLLSNPWLSMLYGWTLQENLLETGVFDKNLNIKFANINGLESSVFQIPIQVDLFADTPGVPYKMTYNSRVTIVTENNSPRVKANFTNIRVPQFAAKMSVAKHCNLSTCTDEWITPSQTFTLDLGQFDYQLCGRNPIDIKFKDSNNKYISSVTPSINSASEWSAYVATLPNLNCGGQVLSITNPSEAPTGPASGHDFLSVNSGEKLYVLSRIAVPNSTDKTFQLHLFTPSVSGGMWQKISANNAPLVGSDPQLSISRNFLILTMAASSGAYTVWTLDLLTAANPINAASPSWVQLPTLPSTCGTYYRRTVIATPQGFSYACSSNDATGFIPQGLLSLNSQQEITQVSLGKSHTCGFVPDPGGSANGGALKCWSDAYQPSFLNGDVTDTSSKSRTVAGINPIALSSGDNFSCAVVADGGTNKVKCWGESNYGKLGDGTNYLSGVKTLAFVKTGVSSDLTDVNKIYSSSTSSCAITGSEATQRVYCWGYWGAGGYGGYATEQSEITNLMSNQSVSVQDLALYGDKYCLVLSDKTVRCSSLGSNLISLSVDVGFTAVEQIASGDEFDCVLRTNNNAKEIQCKGNGFVNIETLTATELGGNSPVQVIAGQNFACALTTINDVYCWRPDNALYANPSTWEGEKYSADTLGKVPLKISGISGARKLFAGPTHTCASVPEGLKCFGRNADWQLGDKAAQFDILKVSSDNQSLSKKTVYVDAMRTQDPGGWSAYGQNQFLLNDKLYVGPGWQAPGSSLIQIDVDTLSTVSINLPGGPWEYVYPIAGGVALYKFSNGMFTRVFGLLQQDGTFKFVSLTPEEVNNNSFDTSSGNFLYKTAFGSSNRFVGLNFDQKWSASFNLSTTVATPEGPVSTGNNHPYFTAFFPSFGFYIFGTKNDDGIYKNETKRIHLIDKILTDYQP